MIVFADTSAIGSAYLGDEADGRWITEVIFNGKDPVVVCDLTDVEFASLLARARRDGRIDKHGVDERLNAYADHTADDGPIGVVPVSTEIIARARSIVLHAAVRTLDAIHLAAAQLLAETNDEPVGLLTRDARQASAALDLRITLYETPLD
ncbi:MAG: type II toxin-antitoxin system VapC family toxin [Acidimicrobiales bacterium]